MGVITMTADKQPENEEIRFLRLAISDGTPRTAAITALIVGSILVVVNQIDQIAVGVWPPFWKIFLTFCVPYLVATYGAVKAKQALAKDRRRGDES